MSKYDPSVKFEKVEKSYVPWSTRTFWRCINISTGTSSPVLKGKINFILDNHKKEGRFPQCGNFKIFLSLRFDKKSILEILEVENLPL